MAHRGMSSEDALQVLRQRLGKAIEFRKTNPKALARAAGLGETVVRDILQGMTKDVKLGTVEKLAKVLGLGIADLLPDALGSADAHSDHPPVRTVDAGETASVMRMDLSYAMGDGTNLDESYIEGEPVVFDISFLRRLTPSSPNLLRIVNGIGDSMQPTIHDREDLILDLGQRALNLQDRIWAISLLGAGAVKRLQAVSKERILVISDNPDVPDREYHIDDITIVGRIVGSIKRH